MSGDSSRDPIWFPRQMSPTRKGHLSIPNGLQRIARWIFFWDIAPNSRPSQKEISSPHHWFSRGYVSYGEGMVTNRLLRLIWQALFFSQSNINIHQMFNETWRSYQIVVIAILRILYYSQILGAGLWYRMDRELNWYESEDIMFQWQIECQTFYTP